MNDNTNDKRLARMISDVVIPPGFRPSSEDEVDAMLDAMGGDDFPEDKVTRIMFKANEVSQIDDRDSVIANELDESLQDQQSELLALHRGEGDELPDNIQRKLDSLRERARADEEGDPA